IAHMFERLENCHKLSQLAPNSRLLRDTRAAGKQVLSNGPSSLAGAISSTAVPERSLGCGAGCAPFRRRRSTDDRPALATARTAGGADPCRAGVRFFLAEPPPRRDWCHRWARLDPGALSR